MNKNIDLDFGTPNRFDLETEILEQLQINSNLHTLIESLSEGDSLDADEVVNTLQGIMNLHQMKFNKLWNTFTALLMLDDHNEH